MAMMVLMAPCIGQSTQTKGKIFRKGAESCSERIKGWLAACSFIECSRTCIVLFYETNSLPSFKFSESVMKIMWIYVVKQCVVNGVGIISEYLIGGYGQVNGSLL